MINELADHSVLHHAHKKMEYLDFPWVDQITCKKLIMSAF